MAIFLDDDQLTSTKMTQIIHAKDSINLWQINNLFEHEKFSDRILPPIMYVADFPGDGIGQEFLLNRQFCGMKKFILMARIAHKMIRLLHTTKQIKGTRRSQFMILWGGFALNLLFAYNPIFTYMINTTLLNLSRRKIENPPDPDDPFEVDVKEIIGDFWRSDVYYVCEECIASGKSTRKFLDLAFKHHLPETIVLFPVCGSLEGVEKIYKVCQEYNRKLVVIFNSAVIEVAKQDGVDLPYTDLGLRPLTIMTKEFYHRAYQRYQASKICWVGDIGDSVYKVIDHYKETLRHMRIFGFRPHVEFGTDLEIVNEWDLTVLLHPMLRTELENEDPETFHYFRNIFHSLGKKFPQTAPLSIIPNGYPDIRQVAASIPQLGEGQQLNSAPPKTWGSEIL